MVFAPGKFQRQPWDKVGVRIRVTVGLGSGLNVIG